MLYEIAAQFSHARAATDIQLHFGQGAPETRERQERIVAGPDPDGVLLADQVSMVSNILVPLRDNRPRETIVDFVSAFATGGIFVVELYHATPEAAAVDAAETMLRTVEDDLLSRQFSESDLEITVDVVDDPTTDIAAKARHHNLVVMGETAQSNADDRVFGPVGTYLVEQTDTPVIIVR